MNKDMIKSVLVLVITCLICSSLLYFVYNLTLPIIEKGV